MTLTASNLSNELSFTTSTRFFASLDKILTFRFLNLRNNMLRNVSLTSIEVMHFEVKFNNFSIPCPLPDPISITWSFLLTLSLLIESSKEL